jgi:hypothetical protein
VDYHGASGSTQAFYSEDKDLAQQILEAFRGF